MISTNENAGGKPADLATIETLTNEFSARHKHLASVVQNMEAAIASLKNMYLPNITAAVNKAAIAKQNLHAAIEASPGLFDKPRTHIFSGIKVGLQKQKGTISFDDADKVVELIEKHYGDNASAYLRTTKAPDISMIEILPITELKKIGCTVVNTFDKVVIKPTDSEIAKTVDALLKAAVENEVGS